MPFPMLDFFLDLVLGRDRPIVSDEDEDEDDEEEEEEFD